MELKNQQQTHLLYGRLQWLFGFLLVFNVLLSLDGSEAVFDQLTSSDTYKVKELLVCESHQLQKQNQQDFEFRLAVNVGFSFKTESKSSSAACSDFNFKFKNAVTSQLLTKSFYISSLIPQRVSGLSPPFMA